MDPRFNIPRGHTACGMSDAVCVFNVTEMLGDPSTWDTCDCPTECNSVQFDTQWDSADFPEYVSDLLVIVKCYLFLSQPSVQMYQVMQLLTVLVER